MELGYSYYLQRILYGLLIFIATLLLFFYKTLLRKVSAKIICYAKEYSKLNRPKNIILIRHGESIANIDLSVYTHTPDNQIPLTENGKEQAEHASKKLKEIIGNDTVKFFVSPYLRGRQTFDIIKNKFNPNKIKFEIDPRIREQEFGNFKDKNPEVVKSVFEERSKIGKFYYRFLNGESGADVYDRADLFIDTLMRQINDIKKNKYKNIVIVCHGIFMTLFLTKFFKIPIEKFDLMANPSNCEIWILEKISNGNYKLKEGIKEDITNSIDEI